MLLFGGEPKVVGLFKENPFPDRPPVYLRMRIYRYRFTNFQEKKETGNYWKRDFIGEYTPEVTLDDFKRSGHPFEQP